MSLTEEHAAYLAAHAVDLELAERLGVRSITSVNDLPDDWRAGLGRHVPGIVFPWTSYDGRVSPQLRPDEPFVNADGEIQKYAFQKGAPSVLWAVRVNPDTNKALFCEGSKQTLVAATYAPPEYSVYGVAGCWGWSHDKKPIKDLRVAKDCDVVVIYDADTATKIDVYNAAVRLTGALEMKGARSIKWVRLPAGRNVGLDDVLADVDAEDRADDLQNLIGNARVKVVDVKPKAKPQVKTRTGPSAGCFGLDGEFLAATTTRIVLEHSPAALTAEGKIAMYADGVYRIDGEAFTGTLCWLLDEEYRPYYRKIVEEFAGSELRKAGAYLPERADAPIVNLRNGMLDLRTGELLPHDPKYLSGIQLAIDYDPTATCPHYDSWIKEQCPDQVEDLEEVSSQMIDPSRCPMKAIFNYGPSKSGKSTFLRLLEAIAGPDHRSAVTLHQLSDDRFAAANVYGSVVNAAADLKADHIEDLSTFKMLTGADSIHANRKYGRQFTFRNRALFAFSANEPPTVGENSRAYSERIKPFLFDRSFAGHDDQAVEDRIRGELPGIFNRLVAAWRGRNERGGFRETTPAVRADFEARSDRVRLWLSERGRVTTRPDGTAPAPRSVMPNEQCTQPRFLAQMFNTWAQEQGGSQMGERKIIARLTSIDGVERVRNQGKSAALNIIAWPVGVDVPDDADDADDTGGSKGSLNPTLASRAEIVEGPRSSASRAIAGCSETTPSAPDAAPVNQAIPDSPEGDTTMIFDLETGSATELLSAGPEWLRLGGYAVGDDIELTTDFAELARRVQSAHVVTGHNVMGFDLIALARHHGLNILELTRRRAVFDTLLAARFVDPPMAREKGRDQARRYDLDSLGAKYELGGKVGDLKALTKEFGGFGKIPTDDPRYREYLTGDVTLSRRLYHHLHKLTGDSEYLFREHRVAAVAASMTLNGFRVDLELLDERLAEGERVKARALRRLHEHYGIPLDGENGERYASPLATKAGKAALITALTTNGVTEGAWWTTGKTGDIATSREAMQELGKNYHENRAVNEICRLVAAVVSVRTVYQTIHNCLVGDRVHPGVTMKQSTGRWSLTSPGLTVMGKRGGRYREREVFIAEPGHVIIACDLSQVDMRAIAGLSGDPAYIEMLRHEDPHAEIAKLLFGTADQREEAKKIGHGWNYGRGIKGICDTYDLPPAVVRKFDESMRERFPRLVEWQDEVRTIAESGKLLDNGFGRPMRPEPSRAHTQGPALMGQGGARDIMMTGLLRLPDEVLPMLRAQVHDEIVLSVPAADAKEIQQTVIDALSFTWESPSGKAVPIVAEGGPTDRTSWGGVYAK